MSSLLNGLLGSGGLTGSWDTANATQIAQNQADANRQNLQNWSSGQATLNNWSSQLANQPFDAAAQENYKAQQANYQQQQGAASMLYNQATGNTPSVADLQMQAGIGQANNAAQSAMLSQQGGVSPGLSQRNMLNAQAMQNAGIVSSGAQNRAQEISTAQNNYGNLLGNMGQTASGMTNTANVLGQQQYQHAANNLDYQTTMNDKGQALNAANTATNYGAYMANQQAQAASNREQFPTLAHTLGAAAGALGLGTAKTPQQQ